MHAEEGVPHCYSAWKACWCLRTQGQAQSLSGNEQADLIEVDTVRIGGCDLYQLLQARLQVRVGQLGGRGQAVQADGEGHQLAAPLLYHKPGDGRGLQQGPRLQQISNVGCIDMVTLQPMAVRTVCGK